MLSILEVVCCNPYFKHRDPLSVDSVSSTRNFSLSSTVKCCSNMQELGFSQVTISSSSSFSAIVSSGTTHSSDNSGKGTFSSTPPGSNPVSAVSKVCFDDFCSNLPRGYLSPRRSHNLRFDDWPFVENV